MLNSEEQGESGILSLFSPPDNTCPLCPQTFSNNSEFLKHMDDIQHHVVDPMEMCTNGFDCDVFIGEYPYCESSEKY